jgi:GNAT superfamily N-acetyltransferase
MSEPRLVVRPLTRGRWADLEALFGPSGSYSNCWCTWWRQTGGEFSAGCREGGTGNRALLERLTVAGRRPGLIAYRGDEPVGWVSVAPRSEYGRILRSPTLRPSPPDDPQDPAIWSVVCFWMPRAERGKGLGRVLLRAATDHARNRGAALLEAYPVDTGGERRPSADLFTGTLAMFKAAGFREVGRRGRSQPIVRLDLRPD